MNRRDFLVAGATSATAIAIVNEAVPAGAEPVEAIIPGLKEPKFRMKYAPHFGMFSNHAGNDPIDELKFMADQGFTALEDNGMKGKSPELQEKIGKTLTDLGMTMGVFVVNGGTAFGNKGLPRGDKAEHERFVKEVKESVDVAKRCGAKWCTVVPGELEPRLEMNYQTANVIEALRRGAEIFEKAGLVMVLEPLNHWTDHPGLFLSEIPQAYLICRAVNSPACKILFDMYHQQITEGNIIPNINKAWSEVAYFQIGDNPGRREPLTGEMNYQNIFKHIHSKGFTGVLGMEHGKSQGGKEGEIKLIKAYRSCDSF